MREHQKRGGSKAKQGLAFACRSDPGLGGPRPYWQYERVNERDSLKSLGKDIVQEYKGFVLLRKTPLDGQRSQLRKS